MITDIDPAANAFWIANNMEPKRYEYDLSPEDTVIDLGAFQGEFASKIYYKYGCKVICVEPTAACNHLSDLPWCAVVNAAASCDDKPLKFGGNSYWTSSLYEGEQVYPCFDILELMYQEIALMKVNIEGMEYPVLARILEAGLIGKIRNLQVQFHQVPMHEKYYRIIMMKLQETHELEWRVPYVWESWKRKI